MVHLEVTECDLPSNTSENEVEFAHCIRTEEENDIIFLK